jgi:hypothetical protein
MQTLMVKRSIKAPASAIFALLADHAGYVHFPGIDRAEIIRPANEGKNGVGLQRRITVGRLRFVEEITVFEPARQMGYHIVRSTLPLQHEQALITLLETAGGTEVVWTSRFRVNIPLLGGVLARLLEREIARGYAGTLKAIERRLMTETALD